MLAQVACDSVHFNACLLKRCSRSETGEDEHLAPVELLEIAFGDDVIRNPNRRLSLIGALAGGGEIEVGRKDADDRVDRVV